jgi:hypothetical protein
VCIHQVRRGVAVESKHSIPVEDVVLDPVVGEIGILDGADADALRDRGALAFIEAWRLFIDQLACPLDRLVQ